MASKADFTADEWKKLLEAPLLAGFAVSAGDPGGFIGTLQEGLANARALAEAKTGGAGGGLIKAVAEDLLTPEGRTGAREGVKALIQGAQLSEMKDRSLAELAKAAKIVDAKAPDEAMTFKAWLEHVANLVAEAGTEGGFLGFGGVKVSETEKATLAELAKALNVC